MDFFQVIDKRHSMRKYMDAQVEEEKLQQILSTTNKAPSAGDLQGYEIYVVRKAEHRQALVLAAGGQQFIAEAVLRNLFKSTQE